MKSDKLIPLFVYGTLKRGFSNHDFLSGTDSKFLGKAQTTEPFALYVGNFPYVTSREPVCPIKGEVYMVDAETLSKIDELEEHPNWYKRGITEVILEDGTAIEAYIYFKDDPEGILIESGFFSKRQDPGL